MPASGQLPPPYIGQGEAAYRRVAWYFIQRRCNDVKCLWRDGCPGGSSSLGQLDGESQLSWATWRLLCLCMDDFEGSLDQCLCLVVIRTPVQGCAHVGSRVLLRGEPWSHRSRCGDVPSAQCTTASGMAAQGRR
jgi:hypothetical protein